MGLMKKLGMGFLFVVMLNYFMPIIIDNLDVSVKIFSIDISNIIIAIMVTIFNMVSFAFIKGIAGMEGTLVGS